MKPRPNDPPRPASYPRLKAMAAQLRRFEAQAEALDTLDAWDEFWSLANGAVKRLQADDRDILRDLTTGHARA